MRSITDEGHATAECATATVTAVAMAGILWKIILAPSMNDLLEKPIWSALSWLF